VGFPGRRKQPAMNAWPRVAFFTDSFHGMDGVATTSRNLLEAARRQALHYLSVRAGQTNLRAQEGSIEVIELSRGPISFALDIGLRFDLLLLRHYQKVLRAVREFEPDVVHITGPGDLGIMGAFMAHGLKLPLVASWHTNLHEFAARRIGNLARFLPAAERHRLVTSTERAVLRACLRFYRIARVVLAPNEEQIHLLQSRIGKPAFPMRRGVDPVLFSPEKRGVRDGVFRLGFVGRLRPEKNVRFLAHLERALLARGLKNFRFLIVGDGSERAWLRANLLQADFPGILRGEGLASAIANMDVFVFPSETDTFGNVILESMAAGTPVVVTSRGGPKYQVQQGITGFVATDESDFVDKVELLMQSPGLHQRQRQACRLWASTRSWEHMLEELREAYEASLVEPPAQVRKRIELAGLALPTRGSVGAPQSLVSSDSKPR
jgi:phosphatidylinositol alpha 1,6-mannosyltransferase